MLFSYETANKHLVWFSNCASLFKIWIFSNLNYNVNFNKLSSQDSNGEIRNSGLYIKLNNERRVLRIVCDVKSGQRGQNVMCSDKGIWLAQSALFCYFDRLPDLESKTGWHKGTRSPDAISLVCSLVSERSRKLVERKRCHTVSSTLKQKCRKWRQDLCVSSATIELAANISQPPCIATPRARSRSLLEKDENSSEDRTPRILLSATAKWSRWTRRHSCSLRRRNG